MLELKNIKKDYPAGDGTVHALKGISLQFRESDFVSILGPSGCGKTTMLNIIGGLDQYTEGDLIIRGVSTKDFSNRDWDAYRNHSIGFVFQSYNLIPHQSVLRNVELALTVSGVSKARRRERAAKALEEVGLYTQMNKKPAQLSGGQMQRVAIARALVNNPDIILADEPTGALDSETSVQVMDILKEVAKDRLVIMVTHNAELANRYSTRIIRMIDGMITDDSAPLSSEEAEGFRREDARKLKEAGKTRRPSMNFATAFGLSLKNLVSKRGRTILTSFAGSIGIIGIAMILAVSQGTTAYIDMIQEDTLSSYPIQIQETHVDMGSLISAFLNNVEEQDKHERDAVYSRPLIYNLINASSQMETTVNDLKSFKEYIDREMASGDGKSGLSKSLSGVKYTYALTPQVYTKNQDGEIELSDARELMEKIMSEYWGISTEIDMSSLSQMNSSMSMMSSMQGNSSRNVWQEMLPGEDGSLVNPLVQKQYDLVYGSWPNQYDEVILVLDRNNELDDMTIYALGLYEGREIDDVMTAAMNQEEIEVNTKRWTYEEMCGTVCRIVLPGDCYSWDEESQTWTDLRSTEAGLQYLYDNGMDLKITGIVRPNEDAVSRMLNGSICYTSALTEYIIEQSWDSPAAKAQQETPYTDIFTGQMFRRTDGSLTDEQKKEEFLAYLDTLTVSEEADTYIRMMSEPTDEQVAKMVEQTVGAMTREDIEEMMSQGMSDQTGMGSESIQKYLENMSDNDLKKLIGQMMTEQIRTQYRARIAEQMELQPDILLAAKLRVMKESMTAGEGAGYYDRILVFSGSSYEYNMTRLGCLDLASPASVNLYASSFKSKDEIERAIEEYNESADEGGQIEYTDYIGLLMSSVTTIINAITYVLIAFVAISLIVSSIMIAVITLISVQERTKEIGILRAIGASRKNVSSMFTAETMIIGFTSGLLGVVVTHLLCFPVNALIQNLTGIASLHAFLPLPAAVILVAISVVLTVLAGIIPARSAAKLDPVEALRSE